MVDLNRKDRKGMPYLNEKSKVFKGKKGCSVVSAYSFNQRRVVIQVLDRDVHVSFTIRCNSGLL